MLAPRQDRPESPVVIVRRFSQEPLLSRDGSQQRRLLFSTSPPGRITIGMVDRNPVTPTTAEARERIAEIGAILALGLVRLRARQSSRLSAPTGESLVASPGTQSGHAGSEAETGRR